MRLLVLGPEEGWHVDRLRAAAGAAGDSIAFAPYESLRAQVAMTAEGGCCAAGPLSAFDVVLARTMPMGSLEQITFRLAVLHAAVAEGLAVINPPRTLELAIDKYATLAAVRRLGYAVPPTAVVHTRREAMAAFDSLGGDVVVKPIFGGEGRGVMRLQDRQLAWVAFGTLEQLGAILYLQAFVPPGGIDTRLLVIGNEVWALRRRAVDDWRTNIACGGLCEAVAVTEPQRAMALRIAGAFGLEIGAVDLIQTAEGDWRLLEVNGVPGWKGAEAALGIDLAARMIEHCRGHWLARPPFYPCLHRSEPLMGADGR
jgi:RimK family alpha-L-glutamate ligase